MTRSELKSLSKENLGRSFKEAIIALIVQWAAIGVLSWLLFFAAGRAVSAFLIAIFAEGPFLVGIASVFLHIAKNEDVNWIDVFDGFKIYFNSCLLFVLKYVFVTLWTCLFVIPGVIAAYRYSMAEYILRENPDMSPIDAIRESKRIMDGRKAELFLIHLSFIGWYLLGAVTFGIALIWVVPYVKCTETNFYLNIKNQYQI